MGVVDDHRGQPLDRSAVVSRGRAVDAESGRRH